MTDPRKTDADLNRRSFERWMVDSGFVLDYPISKLAIHPERVRYFDSQIGLMWRAWCAGQLWPAPDWRSLQSMVEPPRRIVVCAGCGDEVPPEFEHVAVPLPDGAIAVTAFVHAPEEREPF